MFLIASPITAQQAEPGPAAGATISTEPAPGRLPPPSTTEHQQNFGSERLQFTATTLRTALVAAEARAAAAEAKVAEAARERAVLANAEAMIVALRLEIEKLRRVLYGARSERKARLLEQLELQLEGSRPRRPRTTSPPRNSGRQPRRRRPGSAGVRCASPSRRICRASA